MKILLDTCAFLWLAARFGEYPARLQPGTSSEIVYGIPVPAGDVPVPMTCRAKRCEWDECPVRLGD